MNIFSFIVNLALPLGVGFLAANATKDSVDYYKTINRPALSPPAIVFPIVWTILYTLMGISAYLITASDSPNKMFAIKIYVMQLVINFSWSIIFFNYKNFQLAYIILVILWISVAFMIPVFYTISKPAALLQIPYLLWITFAGYLNWNIIKLNKN